MIKTIYDYYKPTCRWDITGTNIMGTLRRLWQCSKCGITVPTTQRNAGFLNSYGLLQLSKGPCPAGGDHDWNGVHDEWLDD